jgi:hypothetical protein
MIERRFDYGLVQCRDYYTFPKLKTLVQKTWSVNGLLYDLTPAVKTYHATSLGELFRQNKLVYSLALEGVTAYASIVAAVSISRRQDLWLIDGLAVLQPGAVANGTGLAISYMGRYNFEENRLYLSSWGPS